MTVKRWIIAGCAVGLMVLGFLFWVAQESASRAAIAQGRWQEKITQIRALTKNGKLIPSMDLLRSLQRQGETFSVQSGILLNALSKSERIPVYAHALEFKGGLFKVQRALLSQAGALSINIPSDIGFKEFTGKELPPSEELQTLSFELLKIKEFIEMLLECPVAEVKELQRGAPAQRGLYRECTFHARFFCAPQAFQKFLSELLAPGSLFVLENFEVRLRSENTLEVMGTVRALSFANTEAGKA